jgi:hypothetical protein
MTTENSVNTPQHLGDNTISKLEAELISDSKVKVSVDLYEGHDRPNLSFMLVDGNGEMLARSFIINSIDQHVDFVLHIRNSQPIFPLSLQCESFFEDDQPVDQKEILIEPPAR